MPTLTITIPCEGCCNPKFCHDLYGDTLQAAVSGVQTCTDCYFFSSLPGQSFKFSFSGVNGVHTLTWNGVDAWSAVIGSETLQIYSDEACGTLDSSTDLNITLSVSCSDNLFLAQISWSGPISGALFETSGAGIALGDPIPNSIASGDCGNGMPPAVVTSGFGGTITLSV